MKAWYEVAKPREDILQGTLDDALFAADLADVLAGRGPVEYRDPERFFQHTYLTTGLKNLLIGVVKRIATGKGDSVIQLKTPFGGGKTHALISLYHLFTNGPKHASEPFVQQVLEGAGMDSLPEVRVVSFVGTKADALEGRTPWGEIAYQLGKYDRLEEHDRRRRAPGGDLLIELLQSQPTLILLDELAVYAIPAKDFRDQILAFTQNLTEAIKGLPHCALVATLPSSAPYGEEGEVVLRQLEQVFGRVQALYTPVEGEEYYHVIRQRLFESIADPTELGYIVDDYFNLYQRHSDNLPDEVRLEVYRQRMRLAYPFHPEVIETLYNRWSTYGTFQRTRGVLKFLASVLRDLHQQKVAVPLILPIHLNLRNPTIQQELIRHIGNEYLGVIHQDIAGGSAQAELLDQQLGSEYQPYRIASGLATAIFFGSFSTGERQGVSEPSLRLASLQPNLPPSVIGDALHKLANKLWYLHIENGLYRFQLEPNLNRIVLDLQEQIGVDEVEDALRKEIEQRVGNEFGAPFLFATQSNDVPDHRQLKLVVLAPDHPHGSDSTKQLVRSLLERVGDKPRVYRNCMIILTADASELTTLRNLVKERLTYERILRDRQTFNRLSEADRGEVKKRLEARQERVPMQVAHAYRHLALMRGTEIQTEIQWYNLGIPTAGERKTLSQRVREYLKQNDLLVDRLAPRFVLDRAVGQNDNKPVAEIVDAFYLYPNLPMVDYDTVVLDALEQGVREGLFAIRSGQRTYFKESVPRSALEYDAVLVREPPPTPVPDLLPVETPSPQEQQISVVEGVGVLIQPPSPPSASPYSEPYRRYTLRATFSSSKASDFVRGVILPIMQAGIDFPLTVEIHVQGELPRHLVDMSILETLKQINAQIDEELKE